MEVLHGVYVGGLGLGCIPQLGGAGEGLPMDCVSGLNSYYGCNRHLGVPWR